jgi:hypothetical protein
LIRRDQGGPFPFGQGHKATEASTTQMRASAAIAIFADQGCNIQAAPGGRGGGPQAREFITQGIVAAHRIAEQIAQALLQGETLDPGPGSEREQHMLIQLPDQDLRHGAAI